MEPSGMPHRYPAGYPLPGFIPSMPMPPLPPMAQGDLMHNNTLYMAKTVVPTSNTNKRKRTDPVQKSKTKLPTAKPKKTAYTFWREKELSLDPKAFDTFTAKEIRAKWNKLPMSVKKPFLSRAKLDLERFRDEKKAIIMARKENNDAIVNKPKFENHNDPTVTKKSNQPQMNPMIPRGLHLNKVQPGQVVETKVTFNKPTPSHHSPPSTVKEQAGINTLFEMPVSGNCSSAITGSKTILVTPVDPAKEVTSLPDGFFPIQSTLHGYFVAFKRKISNGIQHDSLYLRPTNETLKFVLKDHKDLFHSRSGYGIEAICPFCHEGVETFRLDESNSFDKWLKETKSFDSKLATQSISADNFSSKIVDDKYCSMQICKNSHVVFSLPYEQQYLHPTQMVPAPNMFMQSFPVPNQFAGLDEQQPLMRQYPQKTQSDQKIPEQDNRYRNMNMYGFNQMGQPTYSPYFYYG